MSGLQNLNGVFVAGLVLFGGALAVLYCGLVARVLARIMSAAFDGDVKEVVALVVTMALLLGMGLLIAGLMIQGVTVG